MSETNEQKHAREQVSRGEACWPDRASGIDYLAEQAENARFARALNGGKPTADECEAVGFFIMVEEVDEIVAMFKQLTALQDAVKEWKDARAAFIALDNLFWAKDSTITAEDHEAREQRLEAAESSLLALVDPPQQKET